MGWMDFLGGAAAGGIRGLGEYEDRRRRDEDLTENKRRYEAVLQEQALDRAFREQQAQRQAAEFDAQLIATMEGRDEMRALQEREVKLREEEAKARRFEEGANLGREARRRAFIQDPARQQYSPENYQAAFGEGVQAMYVPQLQERDDARAAALQQTLTRMRETRPPLSPDQAILAAQSAVTRELAPRYSALDNISNRTLRAKEVLELERLRQVREQALLRALMNPNSSYEELSAILYPQPTTDTSGDVPFPAAGNATLPGMPPRIPMQTSRGPR